jgi:hypothetical protein
LSHSDSFFQERRDWKRKLLQLQTFTNKPHFLRLLCFQDLICQMITTHQARTANRKKTWRNARSSQGDQIGGIFSCCAVAYFGYFFKLQNFTFFPRLWLILVDFDRKNRLGHIWSDFYTNSSGHPDSSM